MLGGQDTTLIYHNVVTSYNDSALHQHSHEQEHKTAVVTAVNYVIETMIQCGMIIVGIKANVPIHIDQ